MTGRRIDGRINPEDSPVIQPNRTGREGLPCILGSLRKSLASRKLSPTAEDLPSLFGLQIRSWWMDWVKRRRHDQWKNSYTFTEKRGDRIIW
jgi:hypothetical protein